jgi:outer membrane lipoprotein-sorting protein
MKNTILLIAVLLLSAFSISAQDMTLDEVLENHFETIGQDKLSEVQTFKMTGKQMMQGMEFPFTVYVKRPGKIRVEVEIQGNTMVQAYNGEEGWMINPFAGSMDPQDVNEDQLKQFKEQSDIDGKLFNWKEKGYEVELVGKEDMEGTEVYKIKLTEKPENEGEEGDVTYYFIDADSFVILKATAKRTVQGQQIEVDNFQSNYKQVDGIAFSFAMETKMNGNTVSQMTIEEVKLGEDIDDAIFERPVKKEETTTEENK